MYLVHDEVARERMRDLMSEVERERTATRIIAVRRARRRLHRALARLQYTMSIID